MGSRGGAAPCGSSLGGELLTLSRGDCDEIYFSASPRAAILYNTDLLVDQPKPAFPAAALDQPNNDEVDHFLTGGNTLAAGWLREIPVTDPKALQLFTELSKSGRLGAGECSAIAVAVCRKRPLAIDDKAARKRASAFSPKVELLNTETLMVSLIQAGRLSVAEADAIKEDWEQDHRFKLAFKSFANRV